MKISQIAGFLGSGKTTLIVKLARTLADDGKRKVALVVNEIGEIPVDGKIMEESGMRVKDIGGGCICCEEAASFAKTLVGLSRNIKPDHVLVEPTGVAVPHQVKQAAKMSGRDVEMSLGPAIVLFDATRPTELLDMDMLGQLVAGQVKDADYIVVSKVDAVTPEEVERLLPYLKAINETAEIFNVSSFSGEGIDRMVDVILAWEN